MKEQYGRDEIGELLKQVRLETGISRRELAERLGCSESTIKRLETGVTTASEEMWNRCKALDLVGQSHDPGNAEEAAGAAVGAAGGIAGAGAAVAAAGAVPGLSAAGMTSGLAALGLGSMVTGIGVVAAIPIATGLVGYGVVKGIKALVEANNLDAVEVDDVLEIRRPGLPDEASEE